MRPKYKVNDKVCREWRPNVAGTVKKVMHSPNLPITYEVEFPTCTSNFVEEELVPANVSRETSEES